jgi:hypothetical protein
MPSQAGTEVSVEERPEQHILNEGETDKGPSSVVILLENLDQTYNGKREHKHSR